MKAFLCNGPEKCNITEIPESRPAPGEVKLKVLYAGICGSDFGIIHGRNPFASFPLVPGHEFCGEVIESEASNLDIGQRVVVMPVMGCGKCSSCREGNVNRCPKVKLYGVHLNGGFAEKVVVKASQAIPFPDSLDPKYAVFTEPLAVGIHCVRRGDVKVNNDVAIIGGGVIGLTIASMASFYGAKRVLISDIVPQRLQKAKALGISLTVQENEEGIVKFSRKLGLNFDVVFDTVGSERSLEDSLNLLKPGGKLVLVAVPKGGKKPIGLAKLFAEEKVFTASRTYTMEDFKKALSLIVSGDFRPEKLITHYFPFDKIQEALFTAEHEKDKALKVVLKIEN